MGAAVVKSSLAPMAECVSMLVLGYEVWSSKKNAFHWTVRKIYEAENLALFITL